MTSISIFPLPVPNKNTPWHFSKDVFSKVSSKESSHSKLEVLSSDPEFAFIYAYFHRYTPTNRAIKRIYCLHNPRQTSRFENNISTLEVEAINPVFKPRWTQENNASERQK
ncbi:MAG: hypothetical protein ACRDF4_01615, partial [Rhabdochlamydiaceae bacterium]